VLERNGLSSCTPIERIVTFYYHSFGSCPDGFLQLRQDASSELWVFKQLVVIPAGIAGIQNPWMAMLDLTNCFMAAWHLFFELLFASLRSGFRQSLPE
jgi:hypothetical protein